jgi:tRNA (guanine-N7-)-methyltransferase
LAEVDDDSLAEVRIFFPDPWPKKRHHKRRLIQPEFLRLLQQKLTPAGIVRLATDWEPYALWIVEHFAANPDFELLQDDIRAATQMPPASVSDEVRNVTKFEARGERLGHEIRDLQYQRVS